MRKSWRWMAAVQEDIQRRGCVCKLMKYVLALKICPVADIDKWTAGESCSEDDPRMKDIGCVGVCPVFTSFEAAEAVLGTDCTFVEIETPD